MSLLNKLADFEEFIDKSRAANVYKTTDSELLLPEGSEPQSNYGSLAGTKTPKTSSFTTSTPFKVLGALAVVILVARAFFGWRAAQASEAELEDLRLRLETMQEPKCEGYRKMADTICGGEPIVSAGEGGSDLSMHPGCKAIRRPAIIADMARHGIINASTMQDRASNLLDGTDSEWWTHKDAAELTVDILREAHVRQLRLQWWGLSFADEVTISASLDGNTWKQVHMVYNYADVAEDCKKRLSRGECLWNGDQTKQLCRRTCFEAQHPDQVKTSDGSHSGKLSSAAPTMNGWTELAGWPEETRFLKIKLDHGHEDPWKMHEKLGLRRIEVQGSAAWEPCAEAGQSCKCFGSARIWQPSTKTWTTRGSSGALSCTAAAFGIQFGRNTGECQCWPAATEEDALEQCRNECDAIGDKCSAFEYSYITNIHQQKLGPRCCFRSQVGDHSPSRSVMTDDCYRKDA